MSTNSDKIEGIIQTSGRGPTWCHAVDEYGVWHFIHQKNVSTVGRYSFADLKPGSRVRFISVPQSGGRSAGKFTGLEVEVIEL